MLWGTGGLEFQHTDLMGHSLAHHKGWTPVIHSLLWGNRPSQVFLKLLSSQCVIGEPFYLFLKSPHTTQKLLNANILDSSSLVKFEDVEEALSSHVALTVTQGLQPPGLHQHRWLLTLLSQGSGEIMYA